ncbi:MAG: ABC transporter ATP-binding protein [Marivivens sp.]|nr:ABC transporter ATP-binding protein [Marivivens sp.]
MLLKIENLTKSYSGPDGRVPVLQGISLSLDAGETLALTGESGSGKSTLLHLIGGLDHADGGRILVGGQEVTALDDAGRAALRRGMVGLIFQQFNLIPSLTVRDNIRFQARLAGREDPAWAAALTDALGLTEQLTKYPEDLSGGQQQRVAIARTIAARPALILADEPTGNLDEDTADRVMDQLTRLVDEAGATLVLVTHSSALASRMARQCHLSHGRLS